MIHLAELHAFAEIGQRIREAAEVTEPEPANEQQANDVEVRTSFASFRERPFAGGQRILVSRRQPCKAAPYPTPSITCSGTGGRQGSGAPGARVYSTLPRHRGHPYTCAPSPAQSARRRRPSRSLTAGEFKRLEPERTRLARPLQVEERESRAADRIDLGFDESAPKPPFPPSQNLQRHSRTR